MSDTVAATNYWVMNLRFPILWKILKNQKLENITRLTYINISTPCRVLLDLAVKMKKVTFELVKIEPHAGVSGPQLKISSVKNDKGEVIIIDIHSHVLKTRRIISELLMKDFRNLNLIKETDPVSMAAAYIGLKAGDEINSTLFFAHYARWKYFDHVTREKIKNVFYIPKSDWSDILASQIRDLVDEVYIGKKEIKSSTYCFRIFIRSLKGLYSILFRPFMKLAGIPFQPLKPSLKNSRVMITYATGLKKNERNDIQFIHDAEIDPSRLMVFFRYPAIIPSQQEWDWIKEHNVRCYCTKEMEGVFPGVHLWKHGSVYKQNLRNFYPQYLKAVFQCLKWRKKHSLWLLEKFGESAKYIAHWKDLFTGNNIGIVMHTIPSPENFIPSMAISELGGIATEFERSIRFDYCTYIHNGPKHIDFVTGPYSLTQVPEPSYSVFTVQSGAANVVNSYPIELVQTARKKGYTIAAVFDEIPNDVFAGDSIRQFYTAILELSRMQPNLFFLVKTKKSKVLENLSEIKKEFDRLVAEGRCLLADWRVTPSTAALNSDFVISVISTAAFESIILGARIMIYYPMKGGCSILYSNNGFNRRIFDNPHNFLDAIDLYLKGNDPGIGDCTDIRYTLDPFSDKQGSTRIGECVSAYLRGFDSGLDRTQIISDTNRQYVERYGSNRVTDGNSFESYYEKMKREDF